MPARKSLAVAEAMEICDPELRISVSDRFPARICELRYPNPCLRGTLRKRFLQLDFELLLKSRPADIH